VYRNGINITMTTKVIIEAPDDKQVVVAEGSRGIDEVDTYIVERGSSRTFMIWADRYLVVAEKKNA
jgi:hypothetical protein